MSGLKVHTAWTTSAVATSEQKSFMRVDFNDDDTLIGELIKVAQNNVEELFDYANEKAGELALKAKEISKKNILIAGSLPAQNDTYVLDQRDKKIIEKGFYDQAKAFKDFVLTNKIDNKLKKAKVTLRKKSLLLFLLSSFKVFHSHEIKP